MSVLDNVLLNMKMAVSTNLINLQNFFSGLYIFLDVNLVLICHKFYIFSHITIVVTNFRILYSNFLLTFVPMLKISFFVIKALIFQIVFWIRNFLGQRTELVTDTFCILISWYWSCLMFIIPRLFWTPTSVKLPSFIFSILGLWRTYWLCTSGLGPDFMFTNTLKRTRRAKRVDLLLLWM